METTTKAVTRVEFFESTNQNCRTRLFTDYDFAEFRKAVRTAKRRAKSNKPFYAWGDAGGVSNSYGSVTTTARWGVWTLPDGTVQVLFDRVRISGHAVKHPYYGGERGYMADWNRIQ